MSENQEQSYEAYKNFLEALDAFCRNVTSQCDEMESALYSYRSVLTDDQCDPLLKKGVRVARQIKECVTAAQPIREMVRDTVDVLQQGPQMSR